MGLQHSDPCVLRKYLFHIVDVATMLHLELFEMVAPLYVSGLLSGCVRGCSTSMMCMVLEICPRGNNKVVIIIFPCS